MSWHSFIHGLKHDLSKAGHAIEGAGKTVLKGAEGVVGGVIGDVLGGITGGLMGLNDADLEQMENLMMGGMETGMVFQIFNSFSSSMPKPDSNN